jgi:hypothetical protein
MAYLIWGLGPSLFMNPENYGQSKLVEYGSLKEYTFPDIVSNRYPIFCAIFGVVNLIVAFVASWTISSDNDTFSEVSLVMKSAHSSLQFNEDEKKEILQNLNMKSKMMMVFTNIVNNKQISKSFLKKNKMLTQKLRSFHTRSQELVNIKSRKKLKYFSGVQKNNKMKISLLQKEKLDTVEDIINQKQKDIEKAEEILSEQSNQEIQKSDSNEEVSQEPEVSNKEILSILFSLKFLSIYLVTVFRTGVSFYYSNEMKLLGMNLINDDLFISKATILGFVVNLSVRLSIGKIYALLGFNALYFLQIFSNFLCSALLIFFGRQKIGFLMFMLVQRVSSGESK